MKKLLLTTVCVFMSVCGMAQEKLTFTDQLNVTIDGTSSSQQATVVVDVLDDNFINFNLNNFILQGGDGNEMFVGNISVKDLKLVDKGGYQAFAFNGDIRISEGDKEGVDDWMGPLLGSIPAVLTGKIKDGKAYVSIDINFVELGQIIYVKFGEDWAPATVTGSTSYDVEQHASGANFEALPWTTTAAIETLSDGNINLVLKNVVVLASEEDGVLFGTARFSNIVPSKKTNNTEFSFNGYVTFEAGDSEGIDAEAWGGPAMGNIAVSLNGKYTDSKFYLSGIMSTEELLGQAIKVEYNTDFAPVGIAETLTYTDVLNVAIDDEACAPQNATVTVDKLENGNINFNLKNFILQAGDGNEMFVGNISVNNLALEDLGNGYETFCFQGNIYITEGDKEGVDSWMGPLLNSIPSRMKGKMTGDKLYVTIDIDMKSLGQIIYVKFGTDIEKVDAISSVETGKIADNRIFDLSGRRVAKAQKGIYIINGKKVVR